MLSFLKIRLALISLTEDNNNTKHDQGREAMDGPQEVDGAEQEVGLERAMSATTCDVFNELRLGGQLCDAVIEAEGRRFNAHKNILCGCSPYFR